MIIDLILDRRDDEKDGIFDYYGRKFYREVNEYYDVFPDLAEPILNAMDYGEESDVKKALCKYVTSQNYNEEICDYINSVNWLVEEDEEDFISYEVHHVAKKLISGSTLMAEIPYYDVAKKVSDMVNGYIVGIRQDGTRARI